MKSVDHWIAQNYYERLQLDRDATAGDVKRAYHELARLYHPDSNYYDELLEGAPPGDPQRDEEIFRLITQAYNCLVSRKERERYDLTLGEELDDWDRKKEKERKTPEKKVEVKVQSWSGPDKKKPKQNSSRIRVNVVQREQLLKGTASASPGKKKIRSVSEMIAEQRTEEQAQRRHSFAPQVTSSGEESKGKLGIVLGVTALVALVAAAGIFLYMRLAS